MSWLDILLLAALALCVYLAVRRLKHSGGCHCGGGCDGNCSKCNQCDKSST